ncbi:unnamed protein product, partial [Pleuronectes platessa]
KQWTSSHGLVRPGNKTPFSNKDLWPRVNYLGATVRTRLLCMSSRGRRNQTAAAISMPRVVSFTTRTA